MSTSTEATQIGRANTVGVISERTGEPVSRIEYIVRSRKIRPIARAGNAMVYDETAVERIREEVRSIDSRRSRNPGEGV